MDFFFIAAIHFMGLSFFISICSGIDKTRFLKIKPVNMRIYKPLVVRQVDTEYNCSTVGVAAGRITYLYQRFRYRLRLVHFDTVGAVRQTH